jgi:H/ACA ribonucleoprotein complex subunit 2
LKHIKRGVKEVVKGLRKGEKGCVSVYGLSHLLIYCFCSLVVLAGDISPIDVISHVPVLCEDNDVPYCYIPSKRSLGEAASSKRPTSVLMIPQAKSKGAEYEENLTACIDEVKEMPVVAAAV